EVPRDTMARAQNLPCPIHINRSTHVPANPKPPQTLGSVEHGGNSLMSCAPRLDSARTRPIDIHRIGARASPIEPARASLWHQRYQAAQRAGQYADALPGVSQRIALSRTGCSW